ncbi:MAG: DUF932 domain-containing protein [Pirellulales bacterium]
MPHDLATTNGRSAMMFYGTKPWHGLGTELDAPATAAEAISAAGLDYEVSLASLTTSDGTPVPHRKAVLRNDANTVLGVVGNTYQPIQNAEAFGFLDNVVGKNSLEYHTAGALGRGERIWMLAKLPGYIRVKNSDDITEKFLLLSNAHDGSAALRVFYTPIRVVCSNTLSLAHRKGLSQGLSIRHTGDLDEKIEEAREVLGIAYRYFECFAEQAEQLASYHPTPDQLKSYFEMIYPHRDGDETRRTNNIHDELTRLFEEGQGQDIPQIRKSMWAALNAVTEYIDHQRPTRGQTPLVRANRRLESQWFGSGAKLKARAWETALNIAS